MLHAAGAGDTAALGDLLAAAALIRGRGDRPSPPTLAPAVSQLRASLVSGAPARSPAPRDAARRACQFLAQLDVTRI